MDIEFLFLSIGTNLLQLWLLLRPSLSLTTGRRLLVAGFAGAEPSQVVALLKGYEPPPGETGSARLYGFVLSVSLKTLSFKRK